MKDTQCSGWNFEHTFLTTRGRRRIFIVIAVLWVYLHLQNMQQAGGQLQQGAAGGQGSMQMMSGSVQRAPFENQLQAERQQNLDKINQLKQTLEAAQQQEQQYKSELERIIFEKCTG